MDDCKLSNGKKLYRNTSLNLENVMCSTINNNTIELLQFAKNS